MRRRKPEPDIKRCPRCQSDFPLDQFYRRTNGTLQPYCKPCCKLNAIEWRQRHPDGFKKIIRRYAESPKGRAAQRAYTARHAPDRWWGGKSPERRREINDQHRDRRRLIRAWWRFIHRQTAWLLSELAYLRSRFKRCARCDEMKPLADFTRVKMQKRNHCHSCHNALRRIRYRDRYRDKQIKWSDNWNRSNIEARQVIQSRWYYETKKPRERKRKSK